jgi:predicted nuclease with RNAse H fold
MDTYSVFPVLTVGIDLAAEAARSAVAAIRWGETDAAIEQLALGATDRVLVEAARPADKVGIDCPLGWPVAFVDFVQRHVRGDIRPGEGRDIEARRPLAYRRTDLAVARAGGPIPLSVSSDRIGRAAMRAAGLLSALAMPGDTKDRSGRARVVEVYPAAALRRWGYESRRYKGGLNTETRRTLVDRFFDATSPWLVISSEHRAACVKSDDVFDAVVAALNARAATLPGAVSAPEPHEISEAIIEGWIAVPVGELADLDPGARSMLGKP